MKHPPTHTDSAVTGFCETVSHFHTSQSTGINGLCKHGVIILKCIFKMQSLPRVLCDLPGCGGIWGAWKYPQCTWRGVWGLGRHRWRGFCFLGLRLRINVSWSPPPGPSVLVASSPLRQKMRARHPRVFVSKPFVPQGHHLHDWTEVACLPSFALQHVSPPKSRFLFTLFLFLFDFYRAQQSARLQTLPQSLLDSK